MPVNDDELPGSLDPIASLARELSNWGRWGSDDELGTVNLITPEVIRQACAEVRDGEVIALAIPVASDGPQSGVGKRFNPLHWMTATGIETSASLPNGLGYADDVIVMPLQAGTQWDALAHIFHYGYMWNGYPASEVTSAGAGRNAIQRVAGRVITRGVLLDVAGHLGVSSLDPGFAIASHLLDEVAAHQNVCVRAGDAVLIRTGLLGAHLERRDWAGFDDGPSPGLGVESLRWLKERDVSAIASDTYRTEVYPAEDLTSRLPFHIVGIVHMGLLVGEIFVLDELAAACRAKNRWSFLFVAPALPVVGGTGSPTNPYAIL